MALFTRLKQAAKILFSALTSRLTLCIRIDTNIVYLSRRLGKLTKAASALRRMRLRRDFERCIPVLVRTEDQALLEFTQPGMDRIGVS
jgi:hypothetical protein